MSPSDLPKAELHLHLEGSIDPATLLELRARHGKASTLSEIEPMYRYSDFTGFLMAFKTITEDLQTEEPHLPDKLDQPTEPSHALFSPVFSSMSRPFVKNRAVKQLAGTRNTREPNTYMNAPAAIWVFNASSPKGRSTSA